MALCEHKKTQRMIIASIALGLGLGQELISADTTIMDFIAGTVRNALVKKTTSWRHRKRVRNVASAAVKQNSGPAAHVGCVLSVHTASHTLLHLHTLLHTHCFTHTAPHTLLHIHCFTYIHCFTCTASHTHTASHTYTASHAQTASHTL